MRLLSTIAPSDLRAVRFLLADIDDTMTTDGRLEADAYAALERLARAGVAVIPVTGRPAGWCDMIARFWPVAGVVGENGALAFRYDRTSRKMHRIFAVDEPTRQTHRNALDSIAASVLSAVPRAAIAADQAYRIADLAIDFAEDVEHLTPQEIDTIVGVFEAAGATAKVSSIHVNGWFGTYDKLSMARRFMCETFAIDVDHPSGNGQCVYIGDSPNDAPMFGHFDLSVGVANVRELAPRCAQLPKFITEGLSGKGFVELAETLLSHR